MTPLEFLQRLAALVPRPQLHLIRFHGVLAPNAALRSQIVPRVADQTPVSSNEPGEAPPASTRTWMSWAQLLKRVFAIHITACPQCGGAWPTRAPPRAPARLDAFLHTASCPPQSPVQVLRRPAPFASFPHSQPTRERQPGPIRETWAGQTLLAG